MAAKTETNANPQTNTRNQTNANAAGRSRLPHPKRETTHIIIVDRKTNPTTPTKNS